MKLSPRSVAARVLSLLAAVALFVGITAGVAEATVTYPSDSSKPNLVTLLSGMNQLWQSSGSNNLHGLLRVAEGGRVLDSEVVATMMARPRRDAVLDGLTPVNSKFSP